MKKIKQVIVPNLPESVNNAKIIKWYKSVGEKVIKNELLLEVETDKIIIEVSAPKSGILKNVLEKEGNIVVSKQILANIELENNEKNKHILLNKKKIKTIEINTLSPSVRRNNKKNFLDVKKKNIKKKLNKNICNKNKNIQKKENIKINKIVPMSSLRVKISERLLEAQKNMAMLTTFNEVNMKNVIKIRNKYQNKIQKKFEIKLGFMSFYIKAVSEALKKYPEINSMIDENNNIIYYKDIDINIAVSTSRGLIAPVIKNANFLKMLEIEKKIKYFVNQGNSGKLTLKELSGGTFTITNGGVFGSLFSTPIINPPQSAILGINVIQNRPIAVNNVVKICPMSYLSLSYDHRIIDGKESIGFLKKIKDILEDFTFILFEN
ncbi:dihydrolipoyllysine-residue succinyltransferase [Buchnera aphidicola]|uniref:dihydrolipoyllysine-residue succinyltransferase n=1 Tax=Buchnera aphidicola TaxID=9 RepID=UPI0030EE9CCF